MGRTDLHRWWLKALAQGTVSVLPGAVALDDRVRRARGAYLRTDYVAGKWRHVRAHLKALRVKPGSWLEDRRVIELGTGWFPIVPLGLALHGAEVTTIDTRVHLDRHRVALTLHRVLELVERGTVVVPASPRLELLRDLARQPGGPAPLAALRELGITPYLGDARALAEAPGAVGADLLTSNNTLEHIAPDGLRDIFTEFHRVGARGARMSHYIDLADHYAGFDPSIGAFNFLTLTPRQWRLANNRLAYQNRLRLSDYLALLEETAWRVTRQRNQSGDPSELEGLRLQPPYDALPPEDLLVVRSHLVTRRA